VSTHVGSTLAFFLKTHFLRRTGPTSPENVLNGVHLRTGGEQGVPRIVTYNVHRCLGRDGQISPARIAEVIAACDADIVALQELDIGRARSGGVDQAQEIARELGMHMHFHPALTVMEEHYGDAILTTRPSRLIRGDALPSWGQRRFVEPRGALWACVNVGGADVQIINTHLGLRGPERLMQVDALLGPDWIRHAGCQEPVILAGDLNAIPRSRVYRRLAAHLRDAQLCQRSRRQQATYPSGAPFLRLDHVFVSSSVEVLRAATIRTPIARIASDHLPLLVEFQVVAPRDHHVRREQAQPQH
jgi:endonuclease/exonuclease/phosphatase family metal-dependent hydrolase